MACGIACFVISNPPIHKSGVVYLQLACRQLSIELQQHSRRPSSRNSSENSSRIAAAQLHTSPLQHRCSAYSPGNGGGGSSSACLMLWQYHPAPAAADFRTQQWPLPAAPACTMGTRFASKGIDEVSGEMFRRCHPMWPKQPYTHTQTGVQHPAARRTQGAAGVDVRMGCARGHHYFRDSVCLCMCAPCSHVCQLGGDWRQLKHHLILLKILLIQRFLACSCKFVKPIKASSTQSAITKAHKTVCPPPHTENPPLHLLEREIIRPAGDT